MIREKYDGPIIIVNDDGTESYDHFFITAEEKYHAIVLKHDKNKGKGRALKTAFQFCIEFFEGMIGCVTADSDGQHTASDIVRMQEALIKSPADLILGVREFDQAGVPAKSQFGNNLTRKVFKVLYGKDITDTQTGLRAIPTKVMLELLKVPGERFEFETRMLIYALEKEIVVSEIPIETIYDSKENHSTHFHPLIDSIRIYMVFGNAFGKFLISSLSSSVIDIGIFQILCALFRKYEWISSLLYILVATIAARIVSATYNYLVNYYFVFHSKENHTKSVVKYLALALMQMLCSALLTTGLVAFTETSIELLVKIPVDTVLFLISYCVQKKVVYIGKTK